MNTAAGNYGEDLVRTELRNLKDNKLLLGLFVQKIYYFMAEISKLIS